MIGLHHKALRLSQVGMVFFVDVYHRLLGQGYSAEQHRGQDRGGKLRFSSSYFFLSRFRVGSRIPYPQCLNHVAPIWYGSAPSFICHYIPRGALWRLTQVAWSGFVSSLGNAMVTDQPQSCRAPGSRLCALLPTESIKKLHHKVPNLAGTSGGTPVVWGAATEAPPLPRLWGLCPA